jgi:hypothetical protein
MSIQCRAWRRHYRDQQPPRLLAGAVPTGIQVVTPADFAENTVAVDPVRAMRAVAQIASRSGRRFSRREHSRQGWGDELS